MKTQKPENLNNGTFKPLTIEESAKLVGGRGVKLSFPKPPHDTYIGMK